MPELLNVLKRRGGEGVVEEAARKAAQKEAAAEDEKAMLREMQQSMNMMPQKTIDWKKRAKKRNADIKGAAFNPFSARPDVGSLMGHPLSKPCEEVGDEID